ncbi:exonuclease SbcCD subunit D [Bacillus massilinigeriensis]|uniref:exonuclease SbcCD subunit D n=1 Tax=Bacillus mediterraneensis TaxID=1805474 RepID=UPI0008F807E4|nr:exonuclease SbcCD subunit D [Bacillus mediterraneensis]
MKFIHTGDWHLGKLVHGMYMTSDQRHVLDQFIELVAEEQPDAVIIAGDLYDRSVPPVEAVELLDEILFRINVGHHTPVIAIAGNHDSAERLSFGSSWYRHNHFYLSGKLEKNPSPIHINGVHFHLVPYAEPGTVRYLFDDPSIHSHQDAMKRIIGNIEDKMENREPNVLIGHAFVQGGVTCDSERILSVGGSGCVSAELFEPFSYTALGHLHSPDAINHEKVRYSGSLMKYSFSEAKQRKAVAIIEMNEDGTFKTRSKSLTPKQDMRELAGYLDELLDPAVYQKEKTDDFLKITLLDEGSLIDPIGKLRQVYPNVLHLERKLELKDKKEKNKLSNVNTEKKSDLELFEQFYREMTTAEFSEEKRRVMAGVMDSILKGEAVK